MHETSGMENQRHELRSCVQRVEKTVGALPGVSKASVNSVSEKLFAEYDDSVTPQTIEKAVTDLDYEIAENPWTVRSPFRLAG